eukprot:Lankesteria_metandrocarpae@DN2225_c0_g1_i3.p1
MLIFLVIVLFIIFEFSDIVSPFYSRKAVHMLSGVLLLGVEYNVYIKAFVLTFAALTVLKNWLFCPFRFATKCDVGMTVFASIAASWTLLELPFSWLGPVFFADPMAAIVGRLFPTPPWIHNKTIPGSLTVAAVSFMTLYHVESVMQRFLLSVAVTFAEALGGRYDNLSVFVCLVVYYVVAPAVMTNRVIY